MIGDMARALQREAADVAPYWILGLPVCYVIAGFLGYFVPVRTWRWSVDMLATHSVCTMVLAGSGLSIWPLALVLALALPGMLTAWLGGLAYRLRAATEQADRWQSPIVGNR